MSGTDPTPQAGQEDEGSHAGVGPDVDRAGGGRSAGETSVDEAMGAEAEPRGERSGPGGTRRPPTPRRDRAPRRHTAARGSRGPRTAPTRRRGRPLDQPPAAERGDEAEEGEGAHHHPDGGGPDPERRREQRDRRGHEPGSEGDERDHGEDADLTGSFPVPAAARGRCPQVTRRPGGGSRGQSRVGRGRGRRRLVMGDWTPVVRDGIDVLRLALLAGGGAYAVAGRTGTRRGCCSWGPSPWWRGWSTCPG